MKNTTTKPKSAIGFGKGGIGKSTMFASTSALLEQRGVSHNIYSVEKYGGLLQRLRPSTIAIKYSEVRIQAALPDLDPIYFSGLKQHQLVDTGANTTNGVVDWIQSTNLISLAKAQNVSLAFLVFLLPDGPDCLEYLDKLYSVAGANVEWFVIEAPVQFGDFSKVRVKAKDIGATVLSLPYLAARILSLCTENNLPLTTEKLPETLNILERAKICAAGREIAAAIQPLMDFFTKS
jgi:hypothetical protein